jgi:hypothetical protein
MGFPSSRGWIEMTITSSVARDRDERSNLKCLLRKVTDARRFREVAADYSGPPPLRLPFLAAAISQCGLQGISRIEPYQGVALQTP